MLLVSYDISNDKLRTKFSKFLTQYGGRMQYSLFEIKNSKRILNIIQSEITNTFSKKFTESDSVIIFQMSELCTITKYGYAKHQDEDFVFI